MFWKDIGIYLLRSINEGFKKGELSVTQKQGIITCIPKGDKQKQFLKNWRPISLLNCSLKLLPSVITERLKKVLPKLINKVQTGFMTNRYTGDNIRLIYDSLVNAELFNISGMLFLVDFEKAFNFVSWSFIDNIL